MKLDKKLIDKMNKMGYTSSFSFVLFILYKLQNNPKYATLSELPFIIDGDNLLTFLDYYGGKTISIPDKQELLTVVNAISLFQQANFNRLEYNDCKLINDNITTEVYQCYCDICEILKDYEFEQN